MLKPAIISVILLITTTIFACPEERADGIPTIDCLKSLINTTLGVTLRSSLEVSKPQSKPQPKPTSFTLDCGITITESFGKNAPKSKEDLVDLDRACSKAYSKLFKPGDGPKFSSVWKVSFVSRNDLKQFSVFVQDNIFTNPRCHGKDNLYGYTNKYKKHVWSMSNTKSDQFEITFIHELFHAARMFYGKFDENNINNEEILAENFARSISHTQYNPTQ
jgi:hypothetical protein